MNRVDEAHHSDFHPLEYTQESHFQTGAGQEDVFSREEFSPYESSVKLFVGSLPYDIDEEDIVDVFTKFGEVVELSILKIYTWFAPSYTQIFTFLYIFFVVKLVF